jgi:hypothetical protein
MDGGANEMWRRKRNAAHGHTACGCGQAGAARCRRCCCSCCCCCAAVACKTRLAPHIAPHHTVPQRHTRRTARSVEAPRLAARQAGRSTSHEEDPTCMRLFAHVCACLRALCRLPSSRWASSLWRWASTCCRSCHRSWPRSNRASPPQQQRPARTVAAAAVAWAASSSFSAHRATTAAWVAPAAGAVTAAAAAATATR